MTIDRRTLGRMALAAALSGLALSGAAAQGTFPAKPIQLIIPFAPGGATDLTSRALAKAAEKPLGQPIAIINKPAGGGAAAMQEVAKAEPDGYTLINFTAIQAAIAPHMRAVPYDTAKDFTPIMLYGAFNTFVAVRADSPYKSLGELLDYARKNPGVLTAGISVIGASSHLGMARLAREAGAQVTFVPFGGGAPAITALLGRHVGSAVTSGEVLPHVQSGDVRLLATLMARRVPELPDVPTVRESGFDWDINSWLGIAGPPNMPAAVVQKLEQAFLQAMDDAAFKKSMTDLAVATVRADAAGARKQLDDDLETFGDILRALKMGRYAQN
ncbi:MAG: tripartite tricarboxylate transporter substrate binding protein [Alphaproteobacteria bacterium]|nr:tripartite tricarboxylate transporter substrate binding protein [Alphaproteobacteria bacterium]